MKKIKSYLLATIMVLAPALVWAHPGHEHHGTGLELLSHFLVTGIVALGIGAGLFYAMRYFLKEKEPVNKKP